jgi:hypothetical protein
MIQYLYRLDLRMVQDSLNPSFGDAALFVPSFYENELLLPLQRGFQSQLQGENS